MEDLRCFELAKVSCRLPSDRDFIYTGIREWLGSPEVPFALILVPGFFSKVTTPKKKGALITVWLPGYYPYYSMVTGVLL